MRKITIRKGLWCFALFAAFPALAETVYVIDHLAVGVHEEKVLSSAIVKVLPTGTALEVLERNEELVRVRTDEGVEGWVDKHYVMQDKPSQLALLEMEAKHFDALNELDVARAEIESLTITVNSLESAGQLQQTTEEATSDALREMQRLAEENQALKQDLEAAKSLAATAQSIQEIIVTPATEETYGVPFKDRLGLSKWHWVMVLALMVLAFGSGGYLVDWSVRRRHGGFRI